MVEEVWTVGELVLRSELGMISTVYGRDRRQRYPQEKYTESIVERSVG
jgi:hypothetical protein